MPGVGATAKRQARGDSTIPVRPRLLITLLRLCVESVILCGGLTSALVLPTRINTAVAIVFVGFLVRQNREVGVVNAVQCR